MRKPQPSPSGRVRVTSPAPRDVWVSVLDSDPSALVTQTPAWIDLMRSFGGFEDASRLYELADGRRLILPMVRGTGVPAPLATEASLPASWGVGGILAPGGLRAADAAVVCSELARRRVTRISLKPNPLDGDKFRTASPARALEIPLVEHVVPLEGGFGRVRGERFSARVRRNVRRAERSGLTVERDTSGRLVPVLYDLLELSLDRWAQQQNEPAALARWRGHRRDPRRKFELMTHALGESCRIWVASFHGQPAAAIVVLQGTNAVYFRGMMDKDLAGPRRANDLLHQLAIEEACAAGCRHYHMGQSGASMSLASFKEGFGAQRYSHSEYRFERLPLTALDRRARGLVKRVIGFRD